MGRPSYIVFDEEYSLEEMTQRIGVVVTNPCRPLDGYAPIVANGDSLGFVDNYMLSERAERSVHIKTSAIRNTKAEGVLADIFNLSGKWYVTDRYELHSTRLRSISMERYADVFRDLMSAHGEAVRDLLRQGAARDGGAYMLIGFKAAQKPRIQKSTVSGTEAAGGVSTRGIASALGSPVPVDMTASVRRSVTREAFLASTVEDERVFAGLYVKLDWKTQGIQILPKGKLRVKREVIQKGIAYPSGNKLAFAGESSDEEDDEEDDDDDGTEAAGEVDVLI